MFSHYSDEERRPILSSRIQYIDENEDAFQRFSRPTVLARFQHAFRSVSTLKLLPFALFVAVVAAVLIFSIILIAQPDHPHHSSTPSWKYHQNDTNPTWFESTTKENSITQYQPPDHHHDESSDDQMSNGSVELMLNKTAAGDVVTNTTKEPHAHNFTFNLTRSTYNILYSDPEFQQMAVFYPRMFVLQKIVAQPKRRELEGTLHEDEGVQFDTYDPDHPPTDPYHHRFIVDGDEKRYESNFDVEIPLYQPDHGFIQKLVPTVHIPPENQDSPPPVFNATSKELVPYNSLRYVFYPTFVPLPKRIHMGVQFAHYPATIAEHTSSSLRSLTTTMVRVLKNNHLDTLHITLDLTTLYPNAYPFQSTHLLPKSQRKKEIRKEDKQNAKKDDKLNPNNPIFDLNRLDRSVQYREKTVPFKDYARHYKAEDYDNNGDNNNIATIEHALFEELRQVYIPTLYTALKHDQSPIITFHDFTIQHDFDQLDWVGDEIYRATQADGKSDRKKDSKDAHDDAAGMKTLHRLVKDSDGSKDDLVYQHTIRPVLKQIRPLFHFFAVSGVKRFTTFHGWEDYCNRRYGGFLPYDLAGKNHKDKDKDQSQPQPHPFANTTQSPQDIQRILMCKHNIMRAHGYIVAEMKKYCHNQVLFPDIDSSFTRYAKNISSSISSPQEANGNSSGKHNDDRQKAKNDRNDKRDKNDRDKKRSAECCAKLQFSLSIRSSYYVTRSLPISGIDYRSQIIQSLEDIPSSYDKRPIHPYLDRTIPERGSGDDKEDSRSKDDKKDSPSKDDKKEHDKADRMQHQSVEMKPFIHNSSKFDASLGRTLIHTPDVFGHCEKERSSEKKDSKASHNNSTPSHCHLPGEMATIHANLLASGVTIHLLFVQSYPTCLAALFSQTNSMKKGSKSAQHILIPSLSTKEGKIMKENQPDFLHLDYYTTQYVYYDEGCLEELQLVDQNHHKKGRSNKNKSQSNIDSYDPPHYSAQCLRYSDRDYNGTPIGPVTSNSHENPLHYYKSLYKMPTTVHDSSLNAPHLLSALSSPFNSLTASSLASQRIVPRGFSQFVKYVSTLTQVLQDSQHKRSHKTTHHDATPVIVSFTFPTPHVQFTHTHDLYREKARIVTQADHENPKYSENQTDATQIGDKDDHLALKQAQARNSTRSGSVWSWLFGSGKKKKDRDQKFDSDSPHFSKRKGKHGKVASHSPDDPKFHKFEQDKDDSDSALSDQPSAMPQHDNKLSDLLEKYKARTREELHCIHDFYRVNAFALYFFELGQIAQRDDDKKSKDGVNIAAIIYNDVVDQKHLDPTLIVHESPRKASRHSETRKSTTTTGLIHISPGLTIEPKISLQWLGKERLFQQTRPDLHFDP